MSDTHGQDHSGSGGGHHAPTHFFAKYVFSTDHKVIGLQFLLSSLLFVILGGLLALAVRYQIAWPGQNVHYAKLLPGGTLDESLNAPRMTLSVPESNLALWQPGKIVELTKTITADTASYPPGTKATFAGFVHGIAVTVPPGTQVQGDPSPHGIAEPIDAFVPLIKVTGNYNYKAAQALGPSGVTVYADDNGKPGKAMVLEGSHIPRPDGKVDYEQGPVKLDIRRDATQVILQIEDQTIGISQADQLTDFGLTEAQTAQYTNEIDQATQHADSLMSQVGDLQQEQDTLNEQANALAESGDVAGSEAKRKEATDKAVQAAWIEHELATEPVTVMVPVSQGQIQSANATDVNFIKEALTDNAYLTLFTMHASIMIFFVIIPALVGGFGNFTIPLMIGAKDMAFPKINMLAFWISVPVGLLMMTSFWVQGGAAGGGWTMYPPLSRIADASGAYGTHIWVFGVVLIGFSSIVGSINYITTIINMRAPGMSMFRMPLTVWSLFITAILQLFATPVLAAAMILLLLDRSLGTLFFAPIADQALATASELSASTNTGGQPLLFQHLFWFYSHPAVYIMILPAMGVVSDVLAVHARKPIFGYRPMVFAMCSIAGLGFIVWGHHMFQSGMNPILGTTFMASTIMIAVPSAIKTFNWLGTMWGGNIRFTPAMLNALAFVSMFVIGGLSGIFMASSPVDIYIHDTYFIVAHIHYVLFGGSIFGIFAGLYHWYPKMFGRQMNQRWGTIHFWMTFIAFNGTFFLMHIVGIGGHPRRYASIMEYPSLWHLQPLNAIMTMWAIAMGLAQIPFIYNFIGSMPRKLGRGITASFCTLLVGSTAVGVAYWTGVKWLVVQGVPAQGVPAGELSQYLVSIGNITSGTWLGYGAFIVGMLALLVCMWPSFPAVGKAFALVIVGGLVLWAIEIIMWAQSGQLIHWINQLAHNVMVALGYGILAGILTTGVVFTIWLVGGKLKLRCILPKLMAVLMLPLFFSPLVIKPDLFVHVGLPGLMGKECLILGLLLIPGLIYLVIARPRDRFGFVDDINPWHANSLEWQTQSPPIYTNFETIPTVHRGPYEYGSPVVKEDYLPQTKVLPPGTVEPTGH